MKIEKNRFLLNMAVILLLFIPFISCSNSGSDKTGKENKNIPAKIEMAGSKQKSDEIAKTTCTDCHKVDKNGTLIVSEKKLEGSKPPEKGGSHH